MPRILKVGLIVQTMEELREQYDKEKLQDPQFTELLEKAHAVFQKVSEGWSGHNFGLNVMARCGSAETNNSFRFMVDNHLKKKNPELIAELDSISYEIWASLPESRPDLLKCLIDVRQTEYDVVGPFQGPHPRDLLKKEVVEWYARQEYARRDRLTVLVKQIEELEQEKK